MELAQGIFAYPWTQMNANNCNTYLTSGPPPILIDPGHAQLYGHVEVGLTEDGIMEKPELVVVTHAHPDHLEAALALQGMGIKLAMHPIEAEYVNGPGRELAAMMGLSLPQVTADLFLEEGEFEAGGQKFEVHHTPGHSPGHICLYLPGQKALVSGDLIFAQGVGRVDFPGGDAEKLKESITRMSGLDIELLLPGHGPVIKGADQVAQNFKVIQEVYFGML